MKPRVVVGMSGGVDSCVAAALLVEQGYEVIGVTMRLWTLERAEAVGHQHCCSAEDVDDAREVAGLLGIPHFIQNFEPEFNTHVVNYFVSEYARGRTPNPCLACNEHVKFQSLERCALAIGADFLATGHYARHTIRDGVHRLERAVDPSRDQSYFLYTLDRAKLRRLLFPLGELTKAEVRAVARRLGLPVADKPDSQEICFVPNNDYRAFLRERLNARPGSIVDTEGQVVGQHDGVIDFTIGQRRGLGAHSGPRYVVDVQPAVDRIVIGPEEDLLRRGARVQRVHWLVDELPLPLESIKVKLRHKAALVQASLRSSDERDGAVDVCFERPQRAISPGQAAVFYDGDVVLGGGIIEQTWR